MRYAEIAVNVPFQAHRVAARRDAAGADDDVRLRLAQTFSYAVPTALEKKLSAGHLVQVPFGKQEVQGVVVSVSEAVPTMQTRFISALMDETPVATPAQIALAQWMCGYYLVPLFVALQPCLPPGLEQRSHLTVTWRWEGPLPPDLPAEAAQVAPLLQAKRKLRSDQLDRQFPTALWKKAVDQLTVRGLAGAAAELAAPSARIQMEQMVRAVALEPRQALLTSTLGRTTKDSALLQKLWQAGGHTLAVAPAQAPTAKSLEKRGLARYDKTTGALAAAVGPAELTERLLELRRLDKYLPVLELLVAENATVWVGAVYAQTGADATMLRELAEAGLIALLQQERMRDPLANLDVPPDRPLRLTPDQEQTWAALEPALAPGAPSQVFLLHGVTGSGKTEIYLRAIDRVLEAGRQAIVLVPEIALTPQTIRRLAARFPGRLTTLHSQLSDGERYDQWRRMRAGQVDIVIGPRSAIFAPMPRLGLIVMDEEHEDAYKSEAMPTYHAREVAVERARLEGCPLILGSATPNLETYYQTVQGRFRLLELPNRVMGHSTAIEAQCRRLELTPARPNLHPLGPEYGDACFIDLPEVELVDLRDELRAGNRSIFSRSLQREMRRVLAGNEQAILFLNRRGTATNVSCRDCGYVVQCPRCNIPMTYHGSATSLVCHHCNQRRPSPAVCPQCGSKRIRFLGSGTEQVEESIRELFPTARTLRWDRDTTTAKGSHEAVLEQFIAREADILIGTQMIAKGLDLPLVTLVGVVLADTGLYLPDFRAAERTFQLMAQVAGRAGRSILGGCVVIQTYTPEHYSLKAAATHDFAGFYQEELRRRQEMGYPPFCRLARLVYAHKDERRTQLEAEAVADKLRRYLAQSGQKAAALAGPAPCFFGRLRDHYRWQIIVRAPDPAEALARFGLPAGWRLDIDPASLL